MAFWSSQTVKDRLGAKGADILVPFDPDLVRQGAVQMRVGEFAAKSKDGDVEIVTLKADVVFTVPPGQFALLLTEEILHIPNDVIGFITVKTRYKARGLVNVSGFHVDPGFQGRLKFWVYNAGNQVIVFKRWDCAFHIWLSQIDKPVSDPYRNDPDQMVISSDDIAKMQHGEVPTPAALRSDFETLKVELTESYRTVAARLTWLIGILSTIGISLLMFFAYKYFAGDTAIRRSPSNIAPAQAPYLASVPPPQVGILGTQLGADVGKSAAPTPVTLQTTQTDVQKKAESSASSSLQKSEPPVAKKAADTVTPAAPEPKPPN